MLERDSFPVGVAEHLGWYVYRLIDPRNGEMFYVGKGRGDRIFAHANGTLAAQADEDSIDLKNLKYQRIREIRAPGLPIGYVIHCHNIANEDTAYQIEAALIDAYPGLTNQVDGHGSRDYGCRHIEEIIAEYESAPFVASEPLLLISVGQTFGTETDDLYRAVRGVWKLSRARAEQVRLVLAHTNGIVRGAFRPVRWLDATVEHFPWLDAGIPGRIGFEGVPAEPEVQSQYVRKRVPDQYRARGAANPVRFIAPDNA